MNIKLYTHKNMYFNNILKEKECELINVSPNTPDITDKRNMGRSWTAVESTVVPRESTFHATS